MEDSPSLVATHFTSEGGCIERTELKRPILNGRLNTIREGGHYIKSELSFEVCQEPDR